MELESVRISSHGGERLHIVGGADVKMYISVIESLCATLKGYDNSVVAFRLNIANDESIVAVNELSYGTRGENHLRVLDGSLGRRETEIRILAQT